MVEKNELLLIIVSSDTLSRVTSNMLFYSHFDVKYVTVFKYDPPSDTNIHPHSIYLLPSLWSFLRCDLRWAKRVANTSQGAGEGFEFVLNKWKPYYFACGESNGFHCQSGMKFFVMPSFRWQ